MNVSFNKSKESENLELISPSELVVKPKEDLQKEKLAAAIKIQSVFRGHLTRLKELESGKEIVYYNPSFGIDGCAVHCIFC